MSLSLSLGLEFFKGAPGVRGRPGNAGFKGPKGDMLDVMKWLLVA